MTPEERAAELRDTLVARVGKLMSPADLAAVRDGIEELHTLTMPSGGARQTFPFPTVLAELIGALTYRPGWTFKLADIERDPGSEGLTFIVRSLGYDTYNPDRGETYGVYHYFPVPPATFNRQGWTSWIRKRLLDVEEHELNEFLMIDGYRPFAPHHGPGSDPYTTFFHGDETDARTDFRGVYHPPDEQP